MLKTIGIQDLEAYTGLPRRTIHFYVKEGLIPPPEGAGRGAYYGWHHVHALKLVSALKAETHLRLEGIREILQQMPPDVMERWVRVVEIGERTASELAAEFTIKLLPEVSGGARFQALDEDGEPRNLMYSIDPPAADAVAGPDPKPGPVMEPGSQRAILNEDALSDNEDDETDRLRRLTAMPERESMRLGASRSRGLLSRLMRKGPSDDAEPVAPETWKRIRLADDVEIHIRDDIDDGRRRQIEIIVELAEGMLDE